MTTWGWATSASGASGAPRLPDVNLVVNPRTTATSASSASAAPAPAPKPKPKPKPAATTQTTLAAPAATPAKTPDAGAQTPPPPPPTNQTDAQGNPLTIEEALRQYRERWNAHPWVNQAPDISGLYPDVSKKWEDFYNQAAARPATPPMNPLMAFAAAMGAPEMTAKTVNDRNQSILAERAQRDKELLDIKRLALQGSIDAAMRQGDWEKALKQLDILNDQNVDLKILEGHIDAIKTHQVGVEQRENLRIKGEEAIRLARERAKSRGGQYAKEIQSMIDDVERNRSSGGIVLASPEDVFAQVAARFNMSHQHENIYMDSSGNIGPKLTTTAVGGGGAVDLSGYKIADLKATLNDPQITADQRALIQKTLDEREQANVKAMQTGQKPPYE